LKKEKSCGCIVLNNKNEILLVKMKMGHWSFPKGHVEANETEFETALRETFEETNINCEIINGFREISKYSPYPNVEKEAIFFLAKALNEEINIQEEEILESGFFGFNEALKILTFDNDKEILLKAKDHIF